MLIALRLVLLAALLAVCVVPHLIVKWLTGRAPVARFFLGAAGWICGLRVERIGPEPPVRSLLLVNHVSWLDILALGGSTNAAFVSKAEVKDHPLVGWLADQRETLYVRRQSRRTIDEQVAAIAERFDHHLPLALFPEGTTSDGSTLLPFRPALLSAVTPAPEDTHVIPVALDYGEDRSFVGWIGGEPGIVNAKRILSRRKPIHVKVRMLAPLDPHDDRKALAAKARDEIGLALFPSTWRTSSL